MDTLLDQINTEKLFAIAWRIASEETVAEAKAFVALVNEAAKLVIKAGLRIRGEQSRFLSDPDTKIVDRIIEEYER